MMSQIIASRVEPLAKPPLNREAGISAEIVEDDMISDAPEEDQAVETVPVNPVAVRTTVKDFIKTIIDGKKADAEKIAALVRLINQGCEVSFKMDMCKTKVAIDNGKVCNTLKPLVKKEVQMNWTAWLKKEMSTLTVRTAQNWMLLADYEETEQYAWLGESRLLRVIREQRKTEPKTNTPISDFLTNLGVDTSQGFNPEVKQKVDDALKAAAKKSTQPASIIKLTHILQKSADNFVKAIGEGFEGLDAETKSQLVTIFRELLERLTD